MSQPADASAKPGVYEFDRDQAFTKDRCFLCGTKLGDSNRTDEHVFSQWIQRRCDLWNQRLTLLNGTKIPYSQVKIPCCFTCNNIHLSPIEKRVQKAFSEGPIAVRSLDPVDLFVWLSKIYYGLLVLELFLSADRSDAASESILSPEWVEQFRMHHMLMQVARGVVRWQPTQFPASIFVFETQIPKKVRLAFDYRDSLFFPFLSIRVGDTAIIAALQDWGSMKNTLDIPMFNAAKQIALHPQQWRQMHAMGIYMTSLFDRTPSHITLHGESVVEIITLPLGGLSGKPLFRDFVVDDYAQALAESLQQPVDEIFDGSKVVDIIGKDDATYVLPFPPDEWPRLSL
jgi:hypothetical protein